MCAEFMNGKDTYRKENGVWKAEINNGRMIKGIQLISNFCTGAVVIDIASYLLLKKDKNKTL